MKIDQKNMPVKNTSSTTDDDAPMIDYVVDDRTLPTIELPDKQSHFTSPSYRLLVYIYPLH